MDPWRLIIENIDRDIWMPMRKQFNHVFIRFLRQNRIRGFQRIFRTRLYFLIFLVLFGRASDEILRFLVNFPFVFVQTFTFPKFISRGMRFPSVRIDSMSMFRYNHVQIDRTIIVHILGEREALRRGSVSTRYLRDGKFHEFCDSTIRCPIGIFHLFQFP